MSKVKTIKLQGKDYAQVKDRLREFREKNPNGLIETTPTFTDDGQILFKAHVIVDKADQSSAEATGHSYGSNSGQKAFEKLETIAVGRALALLGYAVDGEIASSDEMEEFQMHQRQKWQTEVDAIETVEELKAYYLTNKGKGSDFDKYVTARKKELTQSNDENS